MFMKTTLRLALLLALATSATAWAGFPGSASNDYEGIVERDPSAQFGFDVERVNDVRVVDNFDLYGIPFSCHDRSSYREDLLIDDASLPVAHKQFAGTVKHQGFVLKLDGELLSGGAARGVLSLTHKSTLPEAKCYSGLLRWKVEANSAHSA
jgi:hypothetical protein